MPIETAAALVHAFHLYLGCGAIFAIAFVWRGAAAIDAKAATGSLGFRLLLVPGAIALWPLLLAKWRRGSAR